MSETPQIDEAVAENYRQLQSESGLSWEDMAKQFERDAEPLPPQHGAPYLVLAAWARAQDSEPDTEPDDQPDDQPDDEPDSEPEQPADPTPPRKRTTTEKKTTRTG